jgi:hypothetical protein
VYDWQSDDHLSFITQILDRKGFDLPQSKLTADGWRLEQPEVHALLEKLRSKGTPLGNYVNGRFYRGIVTGLNDAFIIDEATKEGLIADHPKSADVIKPFLRGKDVKRWELRQQQWVLFIPWHFPRPDTDTDNQDFSSNETLFQKQYPAVFAHLAQYRDALAGRNSDETGIRYEWYALQRYGATYWQEFALPKIVLPTIERECAFAIDFSGSFGNDKTNCCITDEPYFIAAVLNSALTFWQIKQVAASRQNGYYEFKPMYVITLPIPAADGDTKTTLSKLAEQCEEAKRTSDKVQLQTFEAEIDQIIYRLFDLTPEEIALIENSVPRN